MEGKGCVRSDDERCIADRHGNRGYLRPPPAVGLHAGIITLDDGEDNAMVIGCLSICVLAK